MYCSTCGHCVVPAPPPRNSREEAIKAFLEPRKTHHLIYIRLFGRTEFIKSWYSKEGSWKSRLPKQIVIDWFPPKPPCDTTVPFTVKEIDCSETWASLAPPTPPTEGIRISNLKKNKGN